VPIKLEATQPTVPLARETLLHDSKFRLHVGTSAVVIMVTVVPPSNTPKTSPQAAVRMFTRVLVHCVVAPVFVWAFPEKAKKDKGAPKRGKSAYIIFSTEHRAVVKKDNPSFGFGEIARQISADWKALGKDDKKKYETESKKDKERYETEKAAWEAAGNTIPAPKKKAKKSKKKAAASDDEGEEDDGGDDD